MASEYIKQIYKTLQQQMIADLHTAQVVKHPTDKGDLAELNWLAWFEKYLPRRYSVTKGTVVDCEGNTSEQIDVIIYDRQYSPLVFTVDNITYVAAESVYAVFEVKQDLDKDHIEYAGKKAESVRKLKRTSAKIPYSTGLKPPKELHRIIAGLLTTRCDWKDVESKLREHLQSLSAEQELDVVCAMDNISCRATYNKYPIEGADFTVKTVELEKNAEDNILMYLLLTVLSQLQIIGTVPAIEYDKYFGDVATMEEIYEETPKE